MWLSATTRVTTTTCKWWVCAVLVNATSHLCYSASQLWTRSHHCCPSLTCFRRYLASVALVVLLITVVPALVLTQALARVWVLVLVWVLVPVLALVAELALALVLLFVLLFLALTLGRELALALLLAALSVEDPSVHALVLSLRLPLSVVVAAAACPACTVSDQGCPAVPPPDRQRASAAVSAGCSVVPQYPLASLPLSPPRLLRVDGRGRQRLTQVAGRCSQLRPQCLPRLPQPPVRRHTATATPRRRRRCRLLLRLKHRPLDGTPCDSTVGPAAIQVCALRVTPYRSGRPL